MLAEEEDMDKVTDIVNGLPWITHVVRKNCSPATKKMRDGVQQKRIDN